MSGVTEADLTHSMRDFMDRMVERDAGTWQMARPVFLAVCRHQWQTIRQFGGVTLDEAVAIMTLGDREFRKWVSA